MGRIVWRLDPRARGRGSSPRQARCFATCIRTRAHLHGVDVSLTTVVCFMLRQAKQRSVERIAEDRRRILDATVGLDVLPVAHARRCRAAVCRRCYRWGRFAAMVRDGFVQLDDRVVRCLFLVGLRPVLAETAL